MNKEARKNTEMNDSLNIIIEEPAWQKHLPNVEDVAQKVFTTVLSFMRKKQYPKFISQDINVNLALSSDNHVRELNNEFRQKDSPTNVLSFANIDADDFNFNSTETIELGDIIIALETMQKESFDQHISLHDHFCHLFCHGLFHLLGFDHQTDKEATEMENLEILVLKQLNIANPYKE